MTEQPPSLTPDFRAEVEGLSPDQQALLDKHSLDAAYDFAKASPVDLLKIARIISLSQAAYTARAVSGRSGKSDQLTQSLHIWCTDYASNAEVDKVQSICDIDALSRWIVDNNVEATVQPATFGKGIRGLAACNDRPAGSTAASVPAALLITHDTARDSDLGAVLAQFPQLPPESIAVIWTMADRHDQDSPWAPFWVSLPQKLSSGLSMPGRLVDLLQGTSTYAEFATARQHIKDQYQQLKPILDALSTAYPQQLQPAWFTWEAFLWAVQLWYAYAMQVEWPDKSRKDCLVPFASLMNHSIYPHIVRYSRLDPTSLRLKLPLFRPIGKSEQCFLSYGPLSNLNLMLFYGMAIPKNPYDVVPLDLTAQAKPWHRALLTKFGLTMEHQLRNGALPQKLLMAASVLGLPVAALKGLTYRQLQQNMATAEHQQAQYTVLLPSVEQLTQASEQCLALCQQVQGVTDDNMTCCVLVYHEGQLTVLNAVKSQIEALRYVEQPVI